MRSAHSRFAIVVAMSSCIACGKTSSNPAFADGTTTNVGKNSGDGGTRTTTSKDAGAGMATAPQVIILVPKPSSDPNKDTLIAGDKLTAQCQATRSKAKGSHDVNPSGVRMRAVGPDPKMIVNGVVTAGDANVYNGDFNLSALPNGPVTFTCEADDSSMPPVTGTASVDALLDLGPKITIDEPADKSTHALKTPVLVKFEVDPDPVTDSDSEATPMNLHLDVLGQSFDFMEDPSQPGSYTTNIDFDDRTLFPMAPTTAVVTVTADSSRTPDAPTRTVRSTITLDSQGPQIMVMSPMNRAIVRGEVLLQLNITDPSGVKRDTVVGTINRDLYMLTADQWNVSGDMYSQRFDTRPFGTELTELTINITASDTVGNETTASTMLLLDNVPPLISLDPPMIREFTEPGFVCSVPFDPVGPARPTISALSPTRRCIERR